MATQQLPIEGADLPEHGYYYDVSTGEVVQGLTHSWQHRMGPYATRAEAEHALQTARERTCSWDEEDERER